MRARSFLFLCSLFLKFSTAFSGMQTGNVFIEYQSPLPNAHLVMPQTNIILRSPAMIDPSGLFSNLINVTSSGSGCHSGELILADDGQTMIFKPAVQFAVGETATIQMAQGPQTKDGGRVMPTRFEFHISKRDPSVLHNSHRAFISAGLKREPQYR